MMIPETFTGSTLVFSLWLVVSWVALVKPILENNPVERGLRLLNVVLLYAVLYLAHGAIGFLWLSVLDWVGIGFYAGQHTRDSYLSWLGFYGSLLWISAAYFARVVKRGQYPFWR